MRLKPAGEAAVDTADVGSTMGKEARPGGGGVDGGVTVAAPSTPPPPGPRLLSHCGAHVGGIDRHLARRLQAHVDVVGRYRRLHLVPHLELVEALGARGHVEGDELAMGRLDLQQVSVLIDRLDCAGNGDRLFFGSSLTCAQLGRARAKPTANALSIVVIRVMFCSPFGCPWAGGASRISLCRKGLAGGAMTED